MVMVLVVCLSASWMWWVRLTAFVHRQNIIIECVHERVLYTNIVRSTSLDVT